MHVNEFILPRLPIWTCQEVPLFCHLKSRSPPRAPYPDLIGRTVVFVFDYAKPREGFEIVPQVLYSLDWR